MTKEAPLAIGAATDGACSGNPGPGGWAGLIRFEDGSIEEFGGREESTTNNRMELQAALKTMERLKEIPKQNNLKIKTDSKYLINGFSNWIKNWKKKGWVTSSGKPVLNQDLWEALDKARLEEVKMVYVKGHSGEEDNERVDKIAVSFAKGDSIALNKKIKLTSSKESHAVKQTKNKLTETKYKEEEMKKTLFKIEIMEHCSERDWNLNLMEIAALTDISLKELKSKGEAFQWQDWLIEKLPHDMWSITKKKN